MRGKLSRHLGQKGSIIVFTAFLLPVMIIMAGFAVDLGNLYVHKARLQNAADAAALAGARQYAVHINESPLTWATEESDRYVDDNAEKHNIVNEISERNYQDKEDKSTGNIYYRVLLNETVPTYFMRIVNISTKPINAEALAVIVADSSGGSDGGIGKEVFIFRKRMKIVNSIQNPDNFDVAGQIKTFFDGDIAFTDGVDAESSNDKYNYDELQYSTQSSKLDKFFSSKAAGMSVNEAVAKGEEYAFPAKYKQYNMDDLAASARSKLGLEEYDKRSDWSTYSKNFTTKDQLGSINSTTLSQSRAISANPANGDGNIDININSVISGDTSDPVYLYLDESINTINLNVNASNGRPLVVVYTGTGKLHVNFNADFTGILYAPNVTGYDNFLINNYNHTFEGTIIANYLDLQGSGGTYKYKNILGDTGSSSGSGNKKGKITANCAVRLASPGNISWD